MSTSDRAAQGLFRLALSSPARRLRITLYDGHDRIVHQARGDTVVELPPGLYRIRTERNGRTAEQIVEHDRASSVAAPLPGSQRLGPTPPMLIGMPIQYMASAGDPTWTHESFFTEPTVMDTVRRPLGVTRGHASRVHIVLRDRSVSLTGVDALCAALSIRDARDTQVTTFGPEATLRGIWGGEIVLSGPAAEGYYVLRYAGAAARDVGIQLYPGLITQAFLLYREEPHFDTMRIGLSKAGLPEAKEYFENAAVAKAINDGLGMLQNGGEDPLDALLPVLERGRFEAPMLGMVGAHLLLREPRPDLGRIDAMIDRLAAMLPLSPDVQALRILAALRAGREIPAEPIAYPPMLRAGLEAIVEGSHVAPALIPPDSLLEHAAVALFTDCPLSSWTPREPNPNRTAGQASRWLLESVRDATEQSRRAGRPVDALTLAQELHVPRRVVDLAIKELAEAGSRRDPHTI